MATPDIELQALPNGDILATAPPSKYVCDFCRATPVICAYPCQDFALPDAGLYYRGAWAACQDCRRMIDMGFFSALATFVAEQEADSPVDVEALADFLYQVYQVFSQLRTGPAEEIQHEEVSDVRF